MLLLAFRPHAFHQYGFAVHQPESLVFGQRDPVDFTHLLYFLNGKMVQAVGLGVEGKEAGLNHAVGLADVDGTSGIVRLEQVVLHLLRKFRAHVLAQFGALLAALDVEHRLSVG